MARQRDARRKTIFAAMLITAAVALLSPAAFMSAWVHAEALPMRVYSTTVGEVRRIVLSERITARMNTSTGLTVTNSPQLCEVSLNHGEALFDLGRDSARSLRVVAGNTVLSASHSRFSVRVWDAKKVDVIVQSGRVTVGTTTLRKNQFARITPGGIVLREFSDAEINRSLEWTTGHILFSGQTLAEAVTEFNRYNVRQIELSDLAIGSLTIGGRFTATDVDSFVDALRPTGVRRLEGEPVKGDDNTIWLVGSTEPH